LPGRLRGTSGGCAWPQRFVIRWIREGSRAEDEHGELSPDAPDIILVGRIASADIVLRDETVSRVHAKIYVHAADSDEVAQRFRFEAGRDSDFISPIVPR
jgi:hypothetical protein